MKNEGDLRTQFRDLLGRREFQTLESLWVSAIEGAAGNTPPDLAVFLEAADGLIQAAQLEKAEVLLDLTAPLYEKRVDPRAFLGFLRLQCFASPSSVDLRQRFISLWREAYGSASLETVYLELSGLEKAGDLKKAFHDLDRFLRFREGTYVHHPAGWGTGQITAIDPILRQATVNLEKKPNHRVTLEALKTILEPLHEDHLLVLKFKGSERLKEMREADPVALIDTVINSYGNPLELKAIKSHLIPAVVASDDWSKWWGRAKKLLRASGFYRIQDAAPFAVERLKQAVSYEEDLLKAFQKSDWSGRRSLAKKVFRERGKVHPRLHEVITADLQRVVREAIGPQAIEAAILLEKFNLGAPIANSSILLCALQTCSDPQKMVCKIEGGEEQRMAMAVLPQVVKEKWPEAALALLTAGSDSIRDSICELSRKEPWRDRIASRIAEVVRGPRMAPDLFVWAARKSIDGAQDEIFAAVSELTPVELLERILDLLDHLARKGEREGKELTKEALARARSLIGARSHDLLRRVLKDLDRVKGRSLYERILISSGLSEALRIEALDIITRTMPEVTRPQDVPVWEENTIYVTEAGLKKRHEELREIMEVKLPENFRDIGRAASFGDLSENAEYSAALESRDFLTKKATEIRAELNRARLITRSMLKEGEVTLGSKVTFLNIQTGKNQVYRILGPWDGNPDDGVISYRSPIGRMFLGLKINDEVNVQLPSGKENYRILSIEPGI